MQYLQDVNCAVRGALAKAVGQPAKNPCGWVPGVPEGAMGPIQTKAESEIRMHDGKPFFSQSLYFN